MDYIVLDEMDPSDELLRRWAYDERLCLVSQDEDSILACDEHLPALAELVQDPQCPKGAYIADILGLWARETAVGVIGTYGPDKAIAARASLHDFAASFVPRSQAAADFNVYLRRLLNWVTPSPRSDDSIRVLVRDLARDRYGGLDEERWVVDRLDDATSVAVPYGAESLDYWQRFVIDGAGNVTSQLDQSARR